MRTLIFCGDNRSFAYGNSSDVRVLSEPMQDAVEIVSGPNTQKGTPYYMSAVDVFATVPGRYVVGECGSGDCYSSYYYEIIVAKDGSFTSESFYFDEDGEG